jgi:hypothetical protein
MIASVSYSCLFAFLRFPGSPLSLPILPISLRNLEASRKHLQTSQAFAACLETLSLPALGKSHHAKKPIIDRRLSYPHRAKQIKSSSAAIRPWTEPGGDNRVDVWLEIKDDNLEVITRRSDSFGMSGISYCVPDLYLYLERVVPLSFPYDLPCNLQTNSFTWPNDTSRDGKVMDATMMPLDGPSMLAPRCGARPR